MNIEGKLIILSEYTRQRCHQLYKEYVSDPMMTFDEYLYDTKKVDLYFDTKVLAENRRFFAILKDESIIGEIQIKYINNVEGYGTMSILLKNDSVKDMGYGTEAEKMMLKYAKEELKLKTIYADAVKRNMRSKYILEKIGFVYIKSDENLDYYMYSL